jgi:hypothetical protein
MPADPIAIDPKLSLADLEATIGQQEEILGALLTIGNDGAVTLCTFDEEQDPLDGQLVTLQIVPIEGFATPAGQDLVCEGDAFVNGDVVHVAAFRARDADAVPEPVPAAPAESLFDKALRIAVRVNEIGDQSPYQLCFAGLGKSGGSFGFMQGDLAAGQQIVTDTFRQVLAAAGIPDDNITGRLSTHCTGDPLSPAETARVNTALDSPEGRRLVDAMDEAILSKALNDLRTCVAAAAGAGRTIEPVAQIYMLLWINMTGPPSVLLDWLRGNAVTLTRTVPAPGAVVSVADIENYLLASQYFTENPRTFAHLRQSVKAGADVLRLADPVVDEPTPPPAPPEPAGLGPVRLSAARGISLNATQAIQQLVAIVGEATRSLPPDHSLVVTSTLRPNSRVAGTGGISRHATGEAIDVEIFDAQGQRIPNKGPDTTGLYRQLAIDAYHANDRLFPQRHGQLAWGGNFTTGPVDGPRDLMHFDYGGDRGRFGLLATLAQSGSA